MARKRYLRRFRGFQRDAKLMIWAGLIESLVFPLVFGFVLVIYLDVLGYSPVLFGLLAFVMEITHVVVLIGSGYLADRFGRKRIMLIGSIFGTLGMLLLAFLESVPVFLLASFLLGASSGFWGPAFTAMLAEKTSEKRRGYLFSLNSIISHLGSGLITLIAGFIPLFFISEFRYESGEAYRMIYLIALLLKLVALFIIIRLKADKHSIESRDHIPIKKHWKVLLKFGLPHAFTGLGAGIIVPWFALYFKLRFSLEVDVIGMIFAILAFVMAVLTIFLPRMAEKRGTVLISTAFHVSSVIAMIAMPFTPWLAIVVFLFVFRAAMMNIPSPIMTSFQMSKVPEEIRATSISTTSLSWMVPHAAGMLIGGFLWAMDDTLTLPFYIAFVFYVISIVMYAVFFIRVDDKEHAPLSFLPRQLRRH